MGYHQKAGGGWSGDVDILDSLELTTAGEIEELHTKRISASEMIVTKLNGDFVVPVAKHNWAQPNDGHKLTAGSCRKRFEIRTRWERKRS